MLLPHVVACGVRVVVCVSINLNKISKSKNWRALTVLPMWLSLNRFSWFRTETEAHTTYHSTIFPRIFCFFFRLRFVRSSHDQYTETQIREETENWNSKSQRMLRRHCLRLIIRKLIQFTVVDVLSDTSRSIDGFVSVQIHRFPSCQWQSTFPMHLMEIWWWWWWLG